MTAREALGRARLAAIALGNPAEALEWFWKAAQLGRQSGEEIPSAWYNAGFLAAGLNDSRAAEALYQFLRLDSTSVYADRARAYFAAVTAPSVATAGDSAYPVLVNHARRAMAEQDFVAARTFISRATEREPERWEAWAVGAQFLRKLGYLTESRKWLERAIELAPSAIRAALRAALDKT